MKMIYASSSCANEKNITSLYGLSKKFDEDYARLHAVRAVGLRFHNVYGPCPRKDTLLGVLENAVRTGKDVVLYNLGKNQRHFTWIGDVCESILFAISGCECGKVYNVFNPKKNTVAEFTSEFCKYFSPSITLSEEIRVHDKEYQSVDGDLYSIHCKTDIENGIKKMYE